MLPHTSNESASTVRSLCGLPGYLSSIYVTTWLLGGIGEGGSFGPTYFTLGGFLLFYYVGVHVCLFGSWGILDLCGQIDSSVVGALAAVFGYFAVGFGIEILGFDCRDVSYIAWHMWVDLITVGLLLFVWLVVGDVAHVADDGAFFGTGCEHD